MKRLSKYIISFFIIFSIFSLYCLPVSAFQISGFDLNAKGALLISLDTDEVLYSKNAYEKMYPASLTKMLVSVVMLENTQDLENEKIVMTDTAMNCILGTGASVLGLKIGEELTADQALHALLISSGGDVAYAIAEHYGGSVDGFMTMMNETAQKIGMTASHFGNPVGLHDEQTYTTPYDISLLAKYALNFEDFVNVTSLARYTVPATNKSPARTISTTNFLIDRTTNYYYKFAKGIKTGFTDEAGRCVVSTASDDGYNYLCVIMNSPSTGGKRNEFIDSANLYRWAFNNFEYKSVLDVNEPVAEIPVELSINTDHLKLYPKESLTKILPKKADGSTLKLDVKLTADSVSAPITENTVLGTADVIYADEVIGQVELVCHESVKANFFLQAGRVIKNAVHSVVFKIIIGLIAGAVVVYIIICIIINIRPKKKRNVKYIPYDKHSEDKH